MSEKEAVSHHDCDFGKWLYSFGMQQLGHIPEMKSLENVEAQVKGAPVAGKKTGTNDSEWEEF